MDQGSFFIQSTIFNTLSKFLGTSESIFDAIKIVLIMSLTLSLLGFLNKIEYCNYFYYYWNPFYQYLRNKIVGDDQGFTKKIIINEITENKEMNQLYGAFYWYLSSRIDLKNETPLKYSCSNDLCLDDNDELLDSTFNKTLLGNISKKFHFSGHEINYRMGSELITIYGSEKERRRENNIIYLESHYETKDSIDIMDNLCSSVMFEYAKYKSGNKWEQKIYLNRNGHWESSLSHNKRRLDTLILKKGQKERLIQDINLFISSEDWYNDRDIPYRRGYLFYGYPGTGKTSFFKGLSNLLNRHIHCLNFNEIDSDAQLIDLLKGVDYRTTILVIEDIDCLSNLVKDRDAGGGDAMTHQDPHGETPISSNHPKKEEGLRGESPLVPIRIEISGPSNDLKKPETSRLTLSGLLNMLDGVFSTEGRIIIMTSNYPEVLDKALIRPGRIDVKEYFGKCDYFQICQLFQTFYDIKETNFEEKYVSLKDIGEDQYSPAELTGIFLKHRADPQEALNELVKGINQDDEFYEFIKSRANSTSYKLPSISKKLNLKDSHNLQISSVPKINAQISENMFSPQISENMFSPQMIENMSDVPPIVPFHLNGSNSYDQMGMSRNPPKYLTSSS